MASARAMGWEGEWILRVPGGGSSLSSPGDRPLCHPYLAWRVPGLGLRWEKAGPGLVRISWLRREAWPALPQEGEANRASSAQHAFLWLGPSLLKLVTRVAVGRLLRHHFQNCELL